MSASVFFTFNHSFLITLIDHSQRLQDFERSRALELFQQHPTAFHDLLDTGDDEEVKWCMVKNSNLKSHPRFQKMYVLDQANRQALLHALLSHVEPDSNLPLLDSTSHNGDPVSSFIELLSPLPTSTAQDTFCFIKAKLLEADFEYDIFQKIDKGVGGRNRYGLNPRIGAMIDYFSEKNFFQSHVTREQIFEAYMHYTGNRIGKFPIFLSEYRRSSLYKHYYSQLKSLQITKLKQSPSVIP